MLIYFISDRSSEKEMRKMSVEENYDKKNFPFFFAQISQPRPLPTCDETTFFPLVTKTKYT